jgi:hypothetical protein
MKMKEITTEKKMILKGNFHLLLNEKIEKQIKRSIVLEIINTRNIEAEVENKKKRKKLMLKDLIAAITKMTAVAMLTR